MFPRLLQMLCAIILAMSGLSCAQMSPPRNTVENRVDEIVSELVHLSTSKVIRSEAVSRQDSLFLELEEMGSAAVPAIVGHLNQFGPLAVNRIRLANKFAGAWESHRTYSPEKVADALLAILGQITRKTPILKVDIFNGEGTDEDRTVAAKTWEMWLLSGYPGKAP